MRREVGVIHEVHGEERPAARSGGFRIHHVRGRDRSDERYQRDADLSDEVEEWGVALPEMWFYLGFTLR
jgi:hypothetical protein